MIQTIEQHDERTLDWLADRASVGADPVDLPGDLPQGDVALTSQDVFTDVDYAAALLDLVFAAESGERHDAMPETVLHRTADSLQRAQTEHAVEGFVESARPDQEVQRAAAVVRHEASVRTPSTAPRRAGRLPAWAGWVTAGVAALLAVAVWMGPADTSPAIDRTRMLATAQDVTTAEWADWDSPELAGVRGDVVWSESLQAGYMRFSGLPETDPSVEQFQLWIVDRRGLEDAATGRSNRISGGVFDTASASRDPDTGDLIVPIKPSIAVQDAQLFAVTIEQPGGVWVSDMSRRVVIADVSG